MQIHCSVCYLRRVILIIQTYMLKLHVTHRDKALQRTLFFFLFCFESIYKELVIPLCTINTIDFCDHIGEAYMGEFDFIVPQGERAEMGV